MKSDLLKAHSEVLTAKNCIVVSALLIADITDLLFSESKERPELTPYHEAAEMIASQLNKAEAFLRRTINA